MEKIKQYDDNLKIFFNHAILSIDYLAKAPLDVHNEMIFSLTPQYYEKGTVIFRQD